MGTIETSLLSVDSITGDIGRGGWECAASFINAQGYADYSRHAEIYWLPEGGNVWSDDWLLGINGYLLPQSIEWDKGQSKTQVTLATSHVFLENAGLQGIFFETDAAPDPANPHQNTNWTLGKMVKHIVEEHSNVADWVDTTGINVVDSTAINYYTVQQSNSIWNTLKGIGDNEFYVPYFTKNDELIYAVHPMFSPTLPEPVMEVDSRYIIGQPRVSYRDRVRPDQVQMYALTDNGAILQSDYPEYIGTEGRRHKETNIRCNSQPRLDELAQRLYLFLQRNYTVDLQIAGPWGLLMEIYDRIELTYAGGADNGVAFVWDQKKFWISKIQVRRIHNFGALTSLTLEEENYTEGYFYSDYQ